MAEGGGGGTDTALFDMLGSAPGRARHHVTPAPTMSSAAVTPAAMGRIRERAAGAECAGGRSGVAG
jgi:hypothetical protein